MTIYNILQVRFQKIWSMGLFHNIFSYRNFIYLYIHRRRESREVYYILQIIVKIKDYILSLSREICYI